MMTSELFIYGAALLVLFLSVQAGARSGAFSALSWMLSSMLSLLITLRYWFLLSRAAAGYESSAPMHILAIGCFWLPFLVMIFFFLKLRETYVDEFESVTTSFFGRVLGAVFGAVSGAVFVSALLLTASLLAPESFPAGQPTPLSGTLDAMPVRAYRFLETRLAGVDEKDPAHTPLPKGSNAGQTPATFWQ